MTYKVDMGGGSKTPEDLAIERVVKLLKTHQTDVTKILLLSPERRKWSIKYQALVRNDDFKKLIAHCRASAAFKVILETELQRQFGVDFTTRLIQVAFSR